MIRKLFLKRDIFITKLQATKYIDLEFVLFPAKQNMFKWEILLHPQNVINIWFFRLYLIYKYEICIWETACSFACDNHTRSTNNPSAIYALRKKKENNQNSGEISPQDCFTVIKRGSVHQSRAFSFDIIYHMGLCSATWSLSIKAKRLGQQLLGNFIIINCYWIYVLNFIQSYVPGP